MPWFKLDDGFHSHPKVLAAGNAAVGLFVRGGSYCSQHLTDGFISAVVAKGYGNKREIAALVEVGLWEEVDGGYLMPDYLEYNPSAEKVREERAKAAERQRKGRATQQSRRDSQRDNDASHGVTHGASHASSHGGPDPTRPDPSISTHSDNDDPEVPDDQSSSSVNGYESVLGIACLVARVDRTDIRSPSKFDDGTRRNVETEHGTAIRARLALGEPPEQVAETVLGIDRFTLANARRTTA